MFKLVEVEDIVRIPPAKFNENLEEVATEILRSKYSGAIIPEIGLIISILDVKVSPRGKIIPRDPASYHKTVFKVLAFQPLLREVVEGEVISVEDIGIFVRIGPVDGFVHRSQIANDRFTVDRKQGVMVGQKTKRTIAKGDRVRARIIQVSMESSAGRGIRVGLTMNQPYLGKIEWIEKTTTKKKK